MENYFTNILNTHSATPDFRLYRNCAYSVLVFGYTNELGEPRVKKLVTEMPEDDREFRLAQEWYSFLGLDVSVSKQDSITEVDMPWLGFDLGRLRSELQLNSKLGIFNSGFQGIEESHAITLLDNSYYLLEKFYSVHNLVFDDLHPENVLYSPELDYFPFIDTGSFCLGNPRRWNNFRKNFDLSIEYVTDNLVVY